MTRGTYPIVDCRHCGRTGPTRGRGLCPSCRRRLQKYGGLEQYPCLDAPTEPKRPPRVCTWCDRTHYSRTDTCRDCAHLEAGLDLVPSPEDALTDGHWTVTHGVHRWIPHTRNEAA